MELGTASSAISAHVEGGRSVSDASALSQLERNFCDAFVGNGGNATQAVIDAGYSPQGADVQACRLLSRQRVAARIKAQCETFAHTRLPAAIKALSDICADEQRLPKDRIKAANSLIELAGLTAPRGGATINVGVQVNGQQAQAIISSVHEARARRLSDIPTAMPDTLQSDLRDIEQLAIGPPATTPGGDQVQGPASGSCPVPVPSSARHVKPTISCECDLCRDVEAPAEDADGIDAADEFRRAFDDEAPED